MGGCPGLSGRAPVWSQGSLEVEAGGQRERRAMQAGSEGYGDAGSADGGSGPHERTQVASGSQERQRHGSVPRTSGGKAALADPQETMLWCCLKPLRGEGNGTPLQYSCLENPMDRGAW